MECPVCRSGELEWAWTLEDPGFIHGVVRCQGCRKSFDVTPRMSQLEEAAVMQPEMTAQEVRV
jgi:hypothetical protein